MMSQQINNLFSLKGKTAIVTGGAGLLGTEFSRTLAEAGANVVIADVNLPAADQTAASLTSSGLTCKAIHTDITDPFSVKNLVKTTLETFHTLDILVNNAAIDPKFEPASRGRHTSAFENFPLEAWNQALAVNLTGMFLVSQAAGDVMSRQNRGVFVNICSTYGLVGPDQRLYQKEGEPPQYKPVTYSVTKSAVLGFTRYLATYYAGKNIRSNALTPGGIFNNHDEDFVQKYSARTVLGRMAQKNEMNGALLFLASDASSYMTGANLVVDGGWTAW